MYIWEQDYLVWGEDKGCFCHEVNSAEYDNISIGFGRLLT